MEIISPLSIQLAVALHVPELFPFHRLELPLFLQKSEISIVFDACLLFWSENCLLSFYFLLSLYLVKVSHNQANQFSNLCKG